MSTSTTETTPTYWSVVDSPVGPLRVTGDQGVVSSLYMEDQRHRPPDEAGAVRDDDRLRHVTAQLEEYFAGAREEFDVVVAPRGGTVFQRRVWDELRRIPFGATITYGQLAERIGAPRAFRAVGLANGRNPVSIIVPCHRVVGSGGGLTGYGGGLDRKRWLLAHEQATGGTGR